MTIKMQLRLIIALKFSLHLLSFPLHQQSTNPHSVLIETYNNYSWIIAHCTEYALVVLNFVLRMQKVSHIFSHFFNHAQKHSSIHQPPNGICCFRTSQVSFINVKNLILSIFIFVGINSKKGWQEEFFFYSFFFSIFSNSRSRSLSAWLWSRQSSAWPLISMTSNKRQGNWKTICDIVFSLSSWLPMLG